MIVTVTANPSLDLTYVLPHKAAPGVEVQRALTATLEASGKGVNVSRALTAADRATYAVLPVGGAVGRHVLELLDAAGVPYGAVPVGGSTRVNTSVLQPGGRTLKLNGPGSVMSAIDEEAVLVTVEAAVRAAPTDGQTWLAICGSLPPGVDASFVVRLVQAAHAVGARCAVDTSGPALAVALAAGADLLAPNAAELFEVSAGARTAGTDPVALPSAVTALAAQTGCQLLVSLGAAGALWTDGVQCLRASGPALTPVNTAGAGDALAGWLAAAGDPATRLERGVRWGRSACLAPTTVDLAPGHGDRGPVLVEQVMAGAPPWHS